MRFRTIEWKDADRQEFVRFWADRYRDRNEHLYLQHIGGPLTADAVWDLFTWKNGGNLTGGQQRSVQNNYIARLDELDDLPPDLDGAEFLQRWARGGAIWRIFWLHCWSPRRFPIYDQHVYRAAAQICEWAEAEISESDAVKVATYFELYLPFWRELGINTREADQALWTLGKFLKAENGPPPGYHTKG